MIQTQTQKRSVERDYDSIAAAYDARMAQYSARYAADLIDFLSPQRGEVAIDLAGGTGAAGLKLASRIGRDGSVIIVDRAAKMLEIAAERAIEAKLANVRTQVMDAEKLEFPDGHFDLATCALGVMFFKDVPGALAEAKRVLKPGGRIGFTVWSVPERFPFLAVPMAAILRRLAPLPARLLARTPWLGSILLKRWMILRSLSGESPLRFCRPGSLETCLAAQGFSDIRRVLRAFPLEFSSFDEYWETLTLGTPMKSAVERFPKEFDSIREELRTTLKTGPNGEILLFNEAALVLATKPK